MGRHSAAVAPDLTCTNVIGRHEQEVAEEIEGLVPARAWGFKSPLRHNSSLRRDSYGLLSACVGAVVEGTVVEAGLVVVGDAVVGGAAVVVVLGLNGALPAVVDWD